MSYDLVVIGGSGQWVLLEICLRRLQDAGFPFPEGLWIVDTDTARDDDGERLPATLRTQLAHAFEAEKRRQCSFETCLVRPRIPEGQATIRKLLGGDLGLIEAALTSGEREPEVTAGFYARPRLAATWVAVAGFDVPTGGLSPPFLDRDFLSANNGIHRPLVLIGSVAGGTGAGILPQILLRCRREVPVGNWKRPVVAVAILPWFNPELGRGGAQGAQRITRDECNANAAGSVRALREVVSRIEHRAQQAIAQHEDNVELASVPPTTCCFVGPPKSWAERTPPPVPMVKDSDHATDPFIAALVDYLPVLTRGLPPEAMPTRSRGMIGSLVVPRANVPPDWKGPIWCDGLPDALAARERLRNQQVEHRQWVDADVGKRLDVLAQQDYKGAIDGFFARVRAYGSVLRTILLAARSSKNGDGIRLFCETLATEFARRSGELTHGTPDQPGVHHQLEATVEALDLHVSTVTSAEKLARKAACTDKHFTPADLKARVRDLVDDLCAILRSAHEHTTPAPSKQIDEAEAPSSTQDYVLLVDAAKSHDGNVDLSIAEPGGGVRVQSWNSTQVDVLSAWYKSPVSGECDSRSQATTLSLASALAELVPRAEALARVPASASPLGHSVTLWRAALRGLLSVRPIQNQDLHRGYYGKTEELEQNFGSELCLVCARSEPGVLLGFASAEFGFVPNADLVDRGGAARPGQQAQDTEARQLRETFDGVTAALTDDAGDYEILRAFALFHVGSLGFQAFESWPAWARLLAGLAAAPQSQERAKALLSEGTVPSLQVELKIASGGNDLLIRPAPVPRRFDAGILEALRRVNAGQGRAPKFFSHREDGIDDLVSRWCFDPFGDRPLGNATLATLESGRIVDVAVDVLAEAAAAVPSGDDGNEHPGIPTKWENIHD